VYPRGQALGLADQPLSRALRQNRRSPVADAMQAKGEQDYVVLGIWYVMRCVFAKKCVHNIGYHLYWHFCDTVGFAMWIPSSPARWVSLYRTRCYHLHLIDFIRRTCDAHLLFKGESDAKHH
jgi:hypothetical protein